LVQLCITYGFNGVELELELELAGGAAVRAT
jgi:hypothetical protein